MFDRVEMHVTSSTKHIQGCWIVLEQPTMDSTLVRGSLSQGIYGEGGSHGQNLFLDPKVVSFFWGSIEEIHEVSPNSLIESPSHDKPTSS